MLHLTDVELIGNAGKRGVAVSTLDLRAGGRASSRTRRRSAPARALAVLAAGAVEFEIGTFHGDVAKSGAAVHLDLIPGSVGGGLSAIFVIFVVDRRTRMD